MDLSAPHRVPLTWLLEHGNESIRLRTVRDLAPAGYPGLAELEAAVLESDAVQAVVEKQADDGTWGSNLLGLSPASKEGIKDVGTIPQYRRLLELGHPRTGRPFKLADRLLFRLLSRDPDPTLLFEYQKTVSVAADAEAWVRDLWREAATCALVEAGSAEDPRIRGSAHKIATSVSTFLRSELSESPVVRSGKKNVLHPEAYPPSWYSLSLLASMPSLQRERAGFTERLAQFLSVPSTRKTYTIPVGRKAVKPMHVLLGDPMESDVKGNVKDLPLALMFCELMARIGAAASSPGVERVLLRLYGDCDDDGVWRPRRFPGTIRALTPVSHHHYPLMPDARTGESRFVEVTFRLALIAKHMRRELEYC